MGWLIGRIVGLLWIILGISGIVATRKTTQALCKWLKTTQRQTLGLVSLIFGVLLLIAATSARQAWFVLALGIMACLKGIMIIAISKEKLQATIDWWLAAPEMVYKWWAMFVLILGVEMFYVI